MLDKDLRKPRRERTAREAEATAERLAAAKAVYEERWGKIDGALNLMEQATRDYFAVWHPNSSTLIDLLDRVRTTYRAIKDERGLDDEGWENPGYGEE
ncbi:hypothetical protein IFT54_05465 [Sphingomonas sp. CFBP 13714]|uniref:hypothetical protein n=1 Tax=Sphingomonas sp. CFBP 13714 TaxID=2775308 RepID=UPI001780FD3E|nr:hypothetical protein [Sphingomonas sp. CFBP 13714]MBD8699263.1 hypothetical protein [Sphingomonas sp. CFBP 13714]